jgi:hypothetical protein
MDGVVLLGAFAVLCALGVPVAYALGLAAIVGAAWTDIPLEAVMLKISDGTDDFALLAIPSSCWPAASWPKAGMAMRLINLARVFVGAIRGGLALVNIMASTLFGCISGSSVGRHAADRLGDDPADEEGGIPGDLRDQRHDLRLGQALMIPRRTTRSSTRSRRAARFRSRRCSSPACSRGCCSACA